jgi:hypothetical protein
MALPSGADVKIGSYEFMLDQDNDAGAYQHAFETLGSDTQAIDGSPGKRTGNPSVLLWRVRDWSAGSGKKFYDVNDPGSYYDDVSSNPRIPGQVQSRPDVAAGTGLTATSIAAGNTRFAYGQGSLWLFANRQAWYSTDGLAWTAHPSNPIFPASYNTYSAAGVRDEVWVCGWDGTTRRILKVTQATTTQAVSDVTGPRFLGMAELGGYIYGWTGRNLLRYSAQATLPITQARKHKVALPYNDNPTGSFVGDMCASENAVYYMISYNGDAVIFQYKQHRPFPIWQLPAGFTAKSICYNMGTLYCVGQFGGIAGATTGRISLLGMNVSSRQWFHLADFKPLVLQGQAQLATSVSPSYGAQVLVTCQTATTNYMAVYDAELDAISELDNSAVATSSNDSSATFLNKRVFAFINGTTISTKAYAEDQNTPTSAWTNDSAAHDIGYPMDEKTLLGFHVLQDPSIATGTVTVSYQLDEDGSWTAAGTTAGASKHTYFTVSTNAATKKFRQLRIRMVGANGCRVYSVTARCYINTYQEVWKLRLKMLDEKASDGPSSRRFPAWKLRDFLLTTAAAKNVVAFLDGKRYPKKGGTGEAGPGGTPASVDVVIEYPIDSIVNDQSEGSMEVVLRSVVP